ncbi:MAG: hypothetical protein ACPKPY_00820 [Nitrososphaeraceae archaeon]
MKNTLDKKHYHKPVAVLQKSNRRTKIQQMNMADVSEQHNY